MIFVTVGTERFPFDRLLRAMDEAIRRGVVSGPVIAQTGYSLFRPQHMDCRDFYLFAEMRRLMSEADVIVAHAGVGTVLLAHGLHRIPLLMPRRMTLKEHVSDHQLEFARRLVESDRAVVAWDECELLQRLGEMLACLPRTHFQGQCGPEKRGLLEFLSNRLSALDG